MSGKWSALGAALMALLIALGANAAERRPYDAAGFAAAQAAGQPVLIDISAPWCPVCRAQKPIIDSLTSQPAYAALTIFDVDFDRQKDVVRHFGATMQSTLIAFHGGKETARSVGDTSPDSIEVLVSATLSP